MDWYGRIRKVGGIHLEVSMTDDVLCLPDTRRGYFVSGERSDPVDCTVSDFARFGPPPRQFGLIPRSRLYATLNSATDHAGQQGHVTLLCAPAGTGKSMLLSQWCIEIEAGTQIRCAWLSLSEHENNVSVFCASLLAALARSVPLASTRPPASFDAFDRFIGDLCSEIEALETPIVLILDDAHEIHDPIVVSFIDRFLSATPANLSVLVSARYEPPLMWHKLSLDGRLFRVESAELAFDATEIATVLGNCGVDLDDRALDTVVKRTQGWGALVRFAGMYLAGRQDIAQAVAEFANTPRPVSDFLVGELISVLPRRSTEFLLRTSVVTSFTLELAVELAGDSAAATVAELERVNMPIARSDSTEKLTWYSYHPMLRAYLYAEYRRTDASAVRDAHRNASAWFEAHRHDLTAFEHETIVGDPERTRAFLDRRGFGIVLDGYGQELVGALSRVPTEVGEYLGTRLLQLAAAVASRDFATATTYIDLLEKSTWPTDAQCTLFRALQLETVRCLAEPGHSRLTGDLAGRQATGDCDIDAYVNLQLGMSHNLGYAFDESVTCLERAVALGELRHRTAVVLAANRPITEHSASVAALAEYLRAEPPHPTTVIDFADLTPVNVLGVDVPAFGLRAAVTFALQQLDLAANDRRPLAATLRDTTIRLIADGDHPMATLSLIPLVVHACLNIGEVEWATRIISKASDQFGETPDIRLGRAAIYLATGKLSDARSEVDTVAAAADQLVLSGPVYLALLDACIHTRQGHQSYACAALVTALTRARTSTVLRPFLDMKSIVRPMLAIFTGRFGENEDFAEQIRKRLGPAESTGRQILTPTELSVLRELASGDTAEAIAKTLWVSVNTVKTHLRGIYRKLEVGNRRAALLEARSVGLL